MKLTPIKNLTQVLQDTANKIQPNSPSQIGQAQFPLGIEDVNYKEEPSKGFNMFAQTIAESLRGMGFTNSPEQNFRFTINIRTEREAEVIFDEEAITITARRIGINMPNAEITTTILHQFMDVAQLRRWLQLYLDWVNGEFN